MRLSLLVLTVIAYLSKAGIIGIDFGTEFFKTALIEAGEQFKIVENTNSKRKTNNAICFTEETRIFESDAYAKSSSLPVNSILNSLTMLGIDDSEESIKFWKEDMLVSNNLQSDGRGLLGYKIEIDDEDLANRVIKVEEVLAMIFKHAQQLAKNAAKVASVKDCAITIPSYFSINQRQMVMDAAELAGLHVLSLVHENTAAALLYGIDSKEIMKEVPKTVLIVNMGSSNFETSIIRYTQQKTRKGKDVLAIDVIDEHGIPFSGGNDLNLELVKLLIEKFDAQKVREGKVSIKTSDRAIRRLFKEADFVKEVLSANRMTNVKVPEMFEYDDLKTEVTREEFEERAAPVLERIRGAMETILNSEYMDEVTEVELMGGGLRVPSIRKLVQDMTKERKSDVNPGTHMNSDESMALGAGYTAANYSSSYKVKKVFMYQQVTETVYLNVTQKGGCKEPSDDCFEKHMPLFERGISNMGAKKTIQISNHFGPLDFTLYTDKAILITGTTKVLSQHEKTLKKIDDSDKKIALVFKYDKSGILTVARGEAIVTETVKSGDKSEKKDQSYALDVRTTLYGPQPMTKQEKKSAKELFETFEERDKATKKLEEMRNTYETLIYNSRDWINNDDNDKFFVDSKEKSSFLDLIDAEEEWMDNYGYDETLPVYKERKAELDTEVKKFKRRKTVRNAVSKELKNFLKKIEEIESKFNKYIRLKTWLSDEVVEEFETYLEGEREWHDDVQEQLDDHPFTEIFPMSSLDVKARLPGLEDKLKELKAIKKPRKQKKEKKKKRDFDDDDYDD